jgi:hypothetical protein
MMTLGNMRQTGVHSLAITCDAVWCNHQAVLDVDSFADDERCYLSARGWSAQCVVPSVRMRGLIGTSERQPVCLAHTPNFSISFPRGDACFKPKPETIGDRCLCDDAGGGYPPARLSRGIAGSVSMN